MIVDVGTRHITPPVKGSIFHKSESSRTSGAWTITSRAVPPECRRATRVGGADPPTMAMATRLMTASLSRSYPSLLSRTLADRRPWEHSGRNRRRERSIPVHNILMWRSGSVHGAVIAVLMRYSHMFRTPQHILPQNSPKETLMKTWLKPQITESEAGMEVTSYLPAELDRA
jgi:coenzyme PQQ precursor peptide PqqA